MGCQLCLDYKNRHTGFKAKDKCFGGTTNGYFSLLQLTNDGSYILVGSSSSGISGAKTQTCWEKFDYLIVKIDSLGTKQWDKLFERSLIEKCRAKISVRMNGAYLISCDSYSPFSCVNTNNNMGL